jgi:hypothetical protein
MSGAIPLLVVYSFTWRGRGQQDRKWSVGFLSVAAALLLSFDDLKTPFFYDLRLRRSRMVISLLILGLSVLSVPTTSSDCTTNWRGLETK